LFFNFYFFNIICDDFYFYYHITVVLGIDCDIYMCLQYILNSPPPLFFIIPSPLAS
jgi:hypothetical protein